MSLQAIRKIISSSPLLEEIKQWVESDAEAGAALRVKGAAGSVPAFILVELAQSLKIPVICLTADTEDAAFLQSDLEQIIGNRDADPVLFFPPTGHKPYDEEQVADTAPLIQRADTLQQLRGFDRGLVVTSVEAVYERSPDTLAIDQETFLIATGQIVAPESLVPRLMKQGFERVDFVEQPGEMALRGGILDVYPFTGNYPLRIEFFGDEVESIREFDARSQRSISRLTTARIVPNLETTSSLTVSRSSFFSHLPGNSLLAVFEETRVLEKIQDQFSTAQIRFDERKSQNGRASELPSPETLYLSHEQLISDLNAYGGLHFGAFSGSKKRALINMAAQPQPVFNSNMRLLREKISQNAHHDIQTFILCDSRSQQVRLQQLLEEEKETQQYELIVESLHQGFELIDLRLAVYTDHQIFNRYHRPTARKRQRKYGGITLRELRNLSPGDFVVHVDYGIGKFAGLEKITVRGKLQEAVRVLFRDEDVLYVNINALQKLHKYTGKEGHQPKLTKLGTGEWERTKSRAKKRVKDIARNLITLYAKRKESPGFAFSADTVWQRELEASFQYEDTPDQAAASEAVKLDLQQPVPMDRLVCGDVGFGKTEVAVRAAFKAVQDGKQVGVLVPTTILATQHLETFKSRLASFPVKIEALSRFRSAKEQKEILKSLASGDMDIVIGTHRLASKDVKFKNLGLLIIDEEQRFGVSVKERLREMRVNVDTLTLTATPIPRTLQFSLLGARDLSIINTPPPNRQPIVTEIHTFDKNLIRDAIIYETSRGGQVFFIHNRVHNIDEMASTLRLLVPDVRIRTAHGQMKSTELEQVMLDFMEKKFDVLVCTNIIESGLDIPNANTILINRAETFGLSELHQLRGRVGRSDRRAFCYLLVASIHTLTREARQRLQAVEEFSELGGGFQIAMRDMDIRGAGNMLGAEQSGFIEDVGYETYHRILEEAVQELRNEEFSHVFDTARIPQAGEASIDVEEDAYIPEDYLNNSVERLNIYRRISEAPDEKTLEEIRSEMEDRFGPAPESLKNLILAVEIKLLAQQLRLVKVQFKNQRLFIEFPPQEDIYFYEHVFHPLLSRLNQLNRRFVLKDQKGKLRAIVQEVESLAAARETMQQLLLEAAAEV